MRSQIICKSCGELTYNRGHGFCNLCYSRWHYSIYRDKIEERRKKWWPQYYQKNKERMKQYAIQYRKRDDVKKKKAKYDRQYRNLKRFSGNREIVMIRANYRCELCGRTKNLHIHHKDGKSYHNGIPNNNLNNLMVLCKNCHYNKIHKIHGPTKESTKQKISQKKQQRDLIIRRIKNPNILLDGESRKCELCGLISKHNSVINIIALDEKFNFLRQYREAHKLSINEKKELGVGLHFTCVRISRCQKRRTQSTTP